MGYSSRLFGAIHFSPPLNNEQVKAVEQKIDSDSLFVLDVLEESQEVPEGVLVIRTAESIVPIHDDEVRAIGYNYHETDLDACLAALPDGLEFHGYIQVEGEEGERQRLFVKDGKRVTWTAKYLWPDGSTETITH